MKINTSELTGKPLDWAVAVAEGAVWATWRFIEAHSSGEMNYQKDWAQGGEIIEREKIAVAYEPSQIYDDAYRWKAMCAMSDNGHEYGPTPLIAAMRCYVASKLGDEVDVPDELIGETK